MRVFAGLPRSGILAVAVPLAASLALLPSRAAGPYQGTGTKRMAERLEKLAGEADANPQLNPFWSRKRAKALQLLVAKELDPHGAELRLALARELLNAGQTKEAIDELRKLSAQSKRAPGAASELDLLLGMAYLRLGEQDNCIRSHNVESCLFPVRGRGVHGIQRGSRMAIDQFQSVLRRDPGNLSAQWLLNIAYMTVGEHPAKVPAEWLIPAETFASEHAAGRFLDVAPRLGVAAEGLAGGAAVEDFDQDGYLDILVSSSGLRDQLRFYRNNADGTFSERTAEAGLAGLTGGLNL
ncbi:MAG: VCBS repeat-containing protein, partial [Acidobacteria bacterium]|nr:VCBS repeat-containing protein [Acidobacteriota bacterium]